MMKEIEEDNFKYNRIYLQNTHLYSNKKNNKKNILFNRIK